MYPGPGKQSQTICADAEVGGMPQGELARISAHQIPCQPQRRKQRDSEKHLKDVVAAHDQRSNETEDHAEGGDQELRASHTRWLPKIPLGRNDSTSRNRTKSTASAHSFPQ